MREQPVVVDGVFDVFGVFDVEPDRQPEPAEIG
jgi:hypothetical protein